MNLNYLKKIVLVNSWPGGNGKFRVFEVDGGAILQGGNGTGKTSTLILPLLFFGARPSDVMRASKKKNDKFVNRYLPTDSSYIVFEYVKNHQNKMVIVHSPDGENVYYLFCDGEFSDKLFLDERNRFIKTENLRSHLQANGIHAYRKRFSVMQYREIIQSAKRLPLSHKDARTINEAKQRFSLCENNESIAGSEKVALSIISSSPSFQSIKELIAQEVEIFDSGVQEQLSKEMNFKELQRQATIIRQTKTFLTHQDKVKELSVLSQTIARMNEELGQLKHHAQVRLDEQEKLLRESIAEKKRQTSEFERYEREYNELNREYNNTISQLKGDLSDAERRMQKLKDKYQAYQQSDIEGKRRQAAQVEHLENEVRLLKKQLDTLKGAFEKIDRLYQQQIDALEKSFNERISQEKDRLSLEKDKEETIRRNIASRLQEELDELTARYQEEHHNIANEQKKVEVELGRLEQVIASPDSPELKRLTEQEKQLRKTLSDKQKTMNEHLETLASIKDQRLSVETSIEKNRSMQEKYKLHVEKLHEEIKDCRKSLRNVDDMLFFKLASISPQKANIASRALTMGLLKTPVKEELVIKPDDNSILGFEIDTSHLPPQQILDKEELERKLSSLEQEQQRTHEALEELSQERGELDKQAGELYQKNSDAEIALGQVKLEIKQIESRLQKVEADIRTERRKINEQAKQAKRELLTLLKDLGEKDKALAAKYEADKEKVRQNANAAVNDSLERVKAKEDSLREYEEKQRKELERKIAGLEESKRKDLTEQGAQTEAIEACEKAILEQTAKLEAARKAKAEYERYAAWIENEYSLLPEWEEKAKTYQKQLNEVESKQKKLMREFSTALKAHNEKMDEMGRTIRAAEHESAILQQLLNGPLHEVSAKENDETPSLSAERLQKQVRLIHNEMEEHEKNGKRLFMRVMAGLRQHDELYQLCRDLLLQEGLDELDTGKNWKALAPSLRHLMSGTLVKQIDTIKQVFATKSKELVSLDEKLTETEKRILAKGREISRQFNDSGTSFENICALEVDIRTNLSRLPFRKSLSKAAKAFNDAKILAAHETPDDNYFNVIATAVKDIADYKSGMDISSFIEVAVRAKNTEFEPWRVAVTDEELEGISSEGLSLLILISLYAAIKNVIQKNHSAVLLWSIDEIGKLHSNNTNELKAILEKERIQIFGATPEANLKVVEAFNHFYELRSDGKIHKFEKAKRLSPQEAIFAGDHLQPHSLQGESHA